MIALLCDGSKSFWNDLLSLWEPVQIFSDGVALAYYIQQGGECSLALVAVDGAEGMNWATYAKHQRPSLPVVWVSEQAEFEPQSRRIPVDGFLVKPVTSQMVEELLTDILGPPKIKGHCPVGSRQTIEMEDG